ncbi:hypothetical protein RUND412_003507 [Rhizina undulata]
MFKLNVCTAFLMAFGLLLRFASATTPACVLACVNEYPDVSDLKTICASANMASSCLPSKCSDVTAAITAYKATCSSAGYTITEVVTSSSSSAKSSTTERASSTSLSTVTRSSGYPQITSAGNSTVGYGNSTATSLSSAGQVAIQAPILVIALVAGFFVL